MFLVQYFEERRRFFIDTAEEDDDIAVIYGTEGAVFVHDLPLFFHKGADLFGNEPAFKGDACDIIDGLIHGNSVFIGYFINQFHFDCTTCVGSGTGVFMAPRIKRFSIAVIELQQLFTHKLAENIID